MKEPEIPEWLDKLIDDVDFGEGTHIFVPGHGIAVLTWKGWCRRGEDTPMTTEEFRVFCRVEEDS